MADLSMFFKAILDEDKCPVVVCDLEHTVIYMNPASIIKYRCDITGKSIFSCHNEKSKVLIEKAVEWFKADKGHNRIYTFRNDEQNKDVYMVALRDDTATLIGYYEKHEFRNRETMNLYDFT